MFLWLRIPRFIFLACALSAGAGAAAAADILPGPYDAAVEHVVDGDTLAVRVTIWLRQNIEVLVRLRGIDAPELRGRCADEQALAADATAALAALVAGRRVTLTKVEGDKYFGRVVADVATEAGDVGAVLMARGLARFYDGGARRPWCDVGLAAPRPRHAVGGG